MADAAIVAQKLAILRGLRPPGAAWEMRDGGVLAGNLAAAAESLALVDERAADLIAESRPSTALETLPEWEKEFGLPGKCSLAEESVEMRRAAVVAVKGAHGDNSPADVVQVAAAMGYEVGVEEFTPLRAGFRAGDRAFPEEYAHVMKIQAPETAVFPLRAGFRAGDRVGYFGDERMECILTDRVDAHLLPIYAYGE